ncbi:trichothecene efflux pump [Xylariaceae sp. FL1272]|nr:trichothecene efflux pump [Xylariaceae sp. FL1272]
MTSVHSSRSDRGEELDNVKSIREHVEDSDKASAYDYKLKVVMTDGTINYVDRKVVGGDVAEMPDGYFTSPDFILTVVAQCLGNICAYAGWVMPANTLTLINADLGNSPDINWVATAWTLGSSIGFLLFGRLSDIFGRKALVVGSSVLGLIGYIIGAVAPNVNALIAAELIIGIAAAGQLSFGIVLGELVSNKMRGPIIVLVFLAALPFAVFGPVIARLLIQNTEPGWRWCYYMAIIFGALAVVLNIFFYHPPSYDQLHVGGKTRWEQVKEQDYIGMFLFVAGVLLFIIGLSWGGTTYPWTDAKVLATLIVGFFTIIGFGLYETYLCRVPPLMPPRLFTAAKGGYTATVIVAAIGAAVYYSLTVLWPTIITSLYTTDSIQVGLKSSVVGGAILLGQTVGGISLSYVPKVKWQAIGVSVAAFAFITAMYTIDPYHEATTLALAILGIFFIGIVDNIVFAGVTLILPPQDIGLATGVLGSIRAIGGVVAQSLYVSVLGNKLTELQPKYVTDAALNAGLPESSLQQLFSALTSGDFSSVPGIDSDIIASVTTAVKWAYADSFKLVFLVTIPFSIILIIASCFIPDLEKMLGDNVAKKLQRRTKNPNTNLGEKSSGSREVV